MSRVRAGAMTGLVIYILFIVSCTTPPSQPPTASPLPAATRVLLPTPAPSTNVPTRTPTAATATMPARETAGATAQAVNTVQPSVTAQTAVPAAQPSSPQQTTPNAAGTRPTPVSASAFRLDMDAIFPPGEGRETLFDNCIACHTFLPLLQQKTEAEWGMTLTNHRTRYISALPDKDLGAIIKYLAAHFNPDKPLPEPPPHLNWRNWPAY